MSEAELDADLQSIHEARVLARAAGRAQKVVERFDQAEVDAVVEAMAAAGLRESERLARLAHEETGFGNPADKVAKNDFVLERVVAAMRGMRTVGVLRHDRRAGVHEIAEPVGVVAAIIPSTNPTSTAIFKCLIALKARCGIVLSPHPAAAACIQASADVMRRAAADAGAPAEIIGCMTRISMAGTRELMNGDDTDLILATGGIGLVKAAYSAGKPAYGVGPGNVPAYVERTADVAKAIRDIFDGTTFDNGTLCSSEQAIVHDRVIAAEVRREILASGGRILDEDECRRLAAVLITEDYLVDPEYVGRPAPTIAAAAGIDVPDDTRVLVCPQAGVGKGHPLSREKLSPVLALYEVEDWEEGCARCTELLRFGGLGHTLAIHSRDEEVIMQFGLRKPAHRVLVNTVAAVGAVGLTTDLFPSMTLGCGSWGNNITSDNIGPQHLVNVKRLAREVRPYRGAAGSRQQSPATAGVSPGSVAATAARGSRDAAAPGARDAAAADAAGRAPDEGRASGSPEGALEGRVVEFLRHRGVVASAGPVPGAGRTAVVGLRDASRAPAAARAAPSSATPPEPPRGRAAGVAAAAAASGREAGPSPSAAATRPPRATSGGAPAGELRPPLTTSMPVPAPALPPVAEFVAEADVRKALEKGEKIGLGPDTIVTPLARDLGEEHGIFRRR